MKNHPHINIIVTFLLISWIVCLPCHLRAQSYNEKLNDIYFEKLTVENGLSGNVVKCIMQDHLGFLWIGTADGLNRYDGKNFKIFKNDPADMHSISGNIITGIAEDKKGLLWITTQDGGLSCYNRNEVSSRQFEQYKYDSKNKNSVPANNLNGLAIDKNDNVWVITENSGAFRVDAKTKKILGITNNEKNSYTATSTYGSEVIKTDDQGQLWCGLYADLLMRINPWEHKVKNYLHFETKDGRKLNVGTVRCLMASFNTVWFTHNSTLDKYNFNTGDYEQYPSMPEQASEKQNDQWVAMTKDIRGNIWIGSLKNGCYIFDTAAKKFYNLRYDVFDPGSLNDNTVNCLYCDKTGILWAGTNKGICKYDPLASQVMYHHVKDEKRPGLAKLNIYDFYEADDGSFWLATDGGLFVRDKNALDFKCKYSGFQNKPLSIYKFIKCVDGKVYLITNSNNFTYDSKKKLLTQIPFFLNPPVDPGDLQYSYQNSIKTAVIADTTDIIYFKASEVPPHSYRSYIHDTSIKLIRDTLKSCPVLWVGSRGWGVYQYLTLKNYCIIAVHGNENDSMHYLSNNLVQSIIKDKNGTIWVATNGGGLNGIRNKSWYWQNFFYYKNEPSNPYSLSSNSISDMCLDKNGIFWITTYDGVLNRFDPNAKDKKYFTHITGTDGLSRQSMFSVLCDAKNNLWISTASAILKYDISANKFSAWKLKEQLPYDQFPGKKYIGKDGTIYFGGDKFYISFHPDSLLINSAIPRVAITAFKVFNNPADSLLLNNEIKLNHNKNFFSFEFASLNFSNPSENKFAYRLDGVDEDWVQNGNKNAASYTSIPPGTYTFHVKASNNNDVWNENGVSIIVKILPAWWQTWVFRIAFVLALLSLISFLTGYYFQQKIKLQQQQFEKQKAIDNIRSKISGDIHDEIGSGLTKISLMTQRLKMNFENKKDPDPLLMNKITTSSKEIVANLGEIIWTVNPQHDNLASLLAYIRNYIAHFFEDTTIIYMIDFPEEIPATDIHPELKQNLFLVIKESLNNILKHAEATEVKIHFHFSKQAYCFEITDNGKGIADMKGRDFGNGLMNMRNRMEAVHGKFEIVSAINKGTKIILEGKFDS